MERDRELGHVRTEQRKDIAGPEPPRSKPDRAAADGRVQLGVGQRAPRGAVDQRGMVAVLSGTLEHKGCQADVGNLDVREGSVTKHLRQLLIAHRLHQGRGGTGFVFTNQHGRPFDPVTIHTRARKAWKTATSHHSHSTTADTPTQPGCGRAELGQGF